MIAALVVIWLVCGVIAGYIGERKGEGALSFVAGFLFGPFGMIAALLSKGNLVECPHCRSWIDPKASACPRCGRDVPETVQVVASGTWLFWLMFGIVALGLAAYGLWYRSTY